ATSEVLVTATSSISTSSDSAASFAASTCTTELDSAEEYGIPMTSTSSTTSKMSSNWSSTGFMSETPVMLSPAVSQSGTRPASTGSVTEENTIEVSSTVVAAAIAIGVAMGNTISRSPE